MTTLDAFLLAVALAAVVACDLWVLLAPWRK